jgi:hypothetical protein
MLKDIVNRSYVFDSMLTECMIYSELKEQIEALEEIRPSFHDRINYKMFL